MLCRAAQLARRSYRRRFSLLYACTHNTLSLPDTWRQMRQQTGSGQLAHRYSLLKHTEVGEAALGSFTFW
ncbi:hypothetical protein E2C01_087200 [Portunus trituberculatus]|uniref:Uncharacterized protein n=1 Tax=Portunus trituberculatus TaxID=210409 RepID=A0A5B7JGN7_PORTR|nr:hypothetical protein [Portunus trituberculatus]